MRRLATITLTLALLFGLNPNACLFARDEPKTEAPEDEAKTEAPKGEAKPASATDLPPIPPEVEKKLEAARRAVAEAIIAAQDAGLVKTTIDPPPILEILVNGRANDADALKAHSDQTPEVGVSPEVFGAWFTGHGKLEGVTAEKNVRITQPSKGLKSLYDARAEVFNHHLAEARKAKADAAKEEAKKAEAAKEEAMKKEEAKKAEAEAKMKAEAEAKKRVEAEAKEKEKAEAEAKEKAEAEAKERAEAEAKERAEAEAKEKEKAEAEAQSEETKDDAPKDEVSK